jgi:hypothetical protein
MTASIRTAVYRAQAILDGADGADPPRSKESEVAIRRELAGELKRLRQHFRRHNDQLGPLRCYPSGSGRARYFDQKEWYSFGFPSGRVNTLKALAARFGYSGEYFLIYSPLSDLGHARGIEHDLTIAGGKVEIHSPHDPTALAFVGYWACSWQLLVLVHAVRAYYRDAHEDLQRVQQKVKPLLDEIEEEAGETVLGL